MKKLVLAAALLAAALPVADAEESVVRIGVLNDQSSSYSAIGGEEVVTAVRLAIEDFGGEALGRKVELVEADHGNRPELGLSIATEWLEQDQVDVIADMTNSGIAIGVNALLGKNGKLGLFVSPLTDRPTEEDCNGHVVAWAFDAHSMIGATVKALLAEGETSFFILSADTEAGEDQEETVASAVLAGGGEVKGKARAPLGTTDFSAYVQAAEASAAKALIINLSGAELIAAMGEVQRAGLKQKGIDVAVTFLHQADIRSIGTEALQGVRFSTPWFWTKDAESEAWGRRMMAITGHAPGWIAAGTYRRSETI